MNRTGLEVMEYGTFFFASSCVCMKCLPFSLPTLFLRTDNLVDREGKSICYGVEEETERERCGPQDGEVLGHWKGLRPLSKGNGVRARNQISQTVLSSKPQTYSSISNQIVGFRTLGARALVQIFLLISRVKTQSLSLAGSIEQQP